MKNSIKSLVIAAVIAISFSSCFTLEHTVGKGAQGGSVVVEKQWYALWGLVPIGQDIDSKQMAGGAQDYTIVSKHTLGDYIVSAFTGVVTIHRQTVEVKK